MFVKIVDYSLRTSQEGKAFYSLTLQGSVEIVKSANGATYLTNRKCSISTTFDLDTVKSLIGQELPGKIEKVSCQEYQHEIPETGEIITLSHRWEYVAQEQAILRDFTKVYEPSTNGVKLMVA